ncbi:MAG: GGDEF domain-containing protein [Pseudomonadota bacterium]
MNRDLTEQENAQQLDFERIKILYGNMKLGYLGVASAALMLFVTITHFSSLVTASLWLVAVLACNTPRLLISLKFERRLRAGKITPTTIQPWESRITVWSVLAYLATISAIFLPFGDHAADAVLVCALVFMNMVAGAVIMFSTSLSLLFIFLTLITFSIFARFLLLPDPIFTGLAIIFLLGYLQVLRLLKGQHQVITENIALKIENSRFALVDPLTQLSNRRKLEVVIENMLPMAERMGEPFCVAMLDLDHFKTYNDTHGHDAGDTQLVEVAAVLSAHSRQEDLVVRYGGEEFMIVLPRTGLAQATSIAERIRNAIKTQSDLTVSIGLAQYTNARQFDELVRQADKALYAAKRQGRDSVVSVPV